MKKEPALPPLSKVNLSFVTKAVAGSLLAVAIQAGYHVGMTTSAKETRDAATAAGYTVTETGGRAYNCPTGSFYRTKFKGVATATQGKIEDGAVCKSIFPPGFPLFGGKTTVVGSSQPKL